MSESRSFMWLAKYALTGGVKQVPVKMKDNSKYVNAEGYWNLFVIDRDIFTNKEAAVKAAEAMRDKKIAALKKQISKLEKLSFP
jgi:hypothetical protein